MVVKNMPANTGDAKDVGSISGSGRSPGGEHGNPLQYSCLGKFMDRRAWWAIVHGVAKSWTRLSTHTHTHTHTQLYCLQITRSTKSKLINTSKMQSCVSFKKRIVKMSLHLKTVFRLNIFTLQAFFYVLDDGLEIADYKFGWSQEA